MKIWKKIYESIFPLLFQTISQKLWLNTAIHISKQIDVFICMSVSMYTYTYVYKHTHTHTHTHISREGFPGIEKNPRLNHTFKNIHGTN